PRTLSGASGLGSNVSCCPGPPHWWRKMTDLAVARDRAFGAFAASRNCGNDSPSRPVPPTRRTARRVRRLRSIGGPRRFPSCPLARLYIGERRDQRGTRRGLLIRAGSVSDGV